MISSITDLWIFPVFLVVALAVRRVVVELLVAGPQRRRMAAQAEALRLERDRAREAFLSSKAWTAGLVPQAEALAICSQSAQNILSSIHSRRVSCERVVRAHIQRAVAAALAFNCTAQEPFAEALAAAVAVDKRLANAAYVPGPLEGLPVSIKDCFDQKGLHSTCGLASKCKDPVEHDGLIVAALRKAGAIPFVRTTVPQALMAPETASFVFGDTLNPFSPAHTPGGSSGGEAALIAALASPLGLGSDIGGSLRGPAHFCGITTLKPTPGRTTRLGSTIPRNGLGGLDYGLQNHIVPTAGPMGRSVGDVVLALRHCLWTKSTLAADPQTVPLVFDDAQYNATTPYTVGWYETDGFVAAAPAERRAVREAVEALSTLPHVKVVRFDPPRVDDCVYLFFSLLAAEGNFEGFDNGLDGEELHGVYGVVSVIAKLPRLLRAGLAGLLQVLGEKRLARLLRDTGAKSASELYRLVVKQSLLTREWLSAAQAAGIDVLICPPCATSAFTHLASKDLMMACSYNFVFNLIHWPSGVVPVTRVKAEEASVEAYRAVEPTRDKIAKLLAKQQVGAEGLPVGVQVAGLPWADETVLRVMRELEAALRGGAAFDTPARAKEF